MLTVYNDGRQGNRTGQNMCIAFTVDDIDKEYQKSSILRRGVIEPPAVRPWGAVNMSFADPDGNVVYLRSFPKP